MFGEAGWHEEFILDQLRRSDRLQLLDVEKMCLLLTGADGSTAFIPVTSTIIESGVVGASATAAAVSDFILISRSAALRFGRQYLKT